MTPPVVMDVKQGGKKNEDEEEDLSRVTLPSLVLVCLSAISGLLFGYDTGVVSGAMLLIRPEFQLDDLWHQMIVSATILGAFLFSLVGGYTTDRFGRRPTILTAAVMFAVGSFMLAFAPQKELMLAGRFIVGFGVGLGSSSTPMYIAESAPPKFRGLLVGGYGLGCTFGQFFASIVCAVLVDADNGWRWMMGLAAVPALILLVGFLFLPESPRWLLVHGRAEDARRVLQRLRGQDADVTSELRAIQEACDEQERQTKIHSSVFMQILKTPYARRGLLAGCILQAFQQLGGVNTVMYYSASIFEMAGVGSNNLILWMSSAVAATNFVCTIVGMYLIDRIGRRPLVLISCVGSVLALLVLGAGFVLMDSDAPDVQDIMAATGCGSIGTCKGCIGSSLDCGYCFSDSTSSCWAVNASNSDLPVGGLCLTDTQANTWASDWCPSQYSWVAVLSMVAYLFCFAPGMGLLPWVINSEIHATWARGLCSSIATSTNWIFNFIISMVFLFLIEALQESGTFFLFAAITFLGMVLIWLLVPETKGVPLEEIEFILKKRTFHFRSAQKLESKK